jgi:ABC-type branched-subunit amino acid transport system substrate-binding protein
MLAPLNDARAAGWDAFSVIAKSIENDDMNAEKIGLALAKFFDETASAFGLNPLSPWTRRVLREIVQTRKSEWW